MTTLLTPNGIFTLAEYENESKDFEGAVRHVEHELFGRHRVYLEVKRKIGPKLGKQNIPDGYLIDLSGSKPKLYVVENELARHNILKHIAVQILEFSLAFASEPRKVRSILLDALQGEPEKLLKCEEYSTKRGFRNLDHLLDELVHSPFNALVVIDQIPDMLFDVLSNSFKFGVEILELRKYQRPDRDPIFLFEPFLAGIEEDTEQPNVIGKATLPDVSDIDTIVVPAREDGFIETFLGEDRWHQVRIHGTMRPQIKYLAVYRVAPISAFTLSHHSSPLNHGKIPESLSLTSPRRLMKLDPSR